MNNSLLAHSYHDLQTYIQSLLQEVCFTQKICDYVYFQLSWHCLFAKLKKSPRGDHRDNAWFSEIWLFLTFNFFLILLLWQSYLFCNGFSAVDLAGTLMSIWYQNISWQQGSKLAGVRESTAPRFKEGLLDFDRQGVHLTPKIKRETVLGLLKLQKWQTPF